MGEEGLCKSSYFLCCPSSGGHNIETEVFEDEKKKGSKESKKSKLKFSNSLGEGECSAFTVKHPNMRVVGDTVECSVCGVKLGRFSQFETPCPCGILVPGPAVRINAAKVRAYSYLDDKHILDILSIIRHVSYFSLLLMNIN